MPKQVPFEKTNDVLDFATKRPNERLDSIRNGLEVTEPPTCIRFARSLKCSQILKWSESEYVKQFGLKVQPDVQPLQLQARVLKAPTLKYGPGSKQQTIVRAGLSHIVAA
jgi:eukaryotic translation initiation factor 2C